MMQSVGILLFQIWDRKDWEFSAICIEGLREKKKKKINPNSQQDIKRSAKPDKGTQKDTAPLISQSLKWEGCQLSESYHVLALIIRHTVRNAVWSTRLYWKGTQLLPRAAIGSCCTDQFGVFMTTQAADFLQVFLPRDGVTGVTR